MDDALARSSKGNDANYCQGLGGHDQFIWPAVPAKFLSAQKPARGGGLIGYKKLAGIPGKKKCSNDKGQSHNDT
jgi:hypothetical protein